MKRLRTLARLRAKEIDSLPDGEHQDGGGLFLRVEGPTAKRWLLRVTLLGKRVKRGLGPYPLVSLEEARDKAFEIRRAAREGRDSRASQVTFAQVFEQHFAQRQQGLKNPKHIWQWEQGMRVHAFPLIGNKPIAEVAHDDIVDILRPIWRKTPETARRLLQRMRVIFDIAISRGIREKANPCMGVAQDLGKQGDQVEHFRALPWVEMPAFMKLLRSCSAMPITKLAIEFLILTASRSYPVMHARPQEIDWDKRVWQVPGPHMKGEKPFEIPLADRAIEILRSPGVGTRGLLFPSRTGKPLSNMAFTEVLRRMGLGDKVTAHGFRTSFRTWAAETNQCRGEVAEAALAHAIKDKVEAAYRRTTYLHERFPLMQRWADFCACATPPAAV
jgi:integrase